VAGNQRELMPASSKTRDETWMVISGSVERRENSVADAGPPFDDSSPSKGFSQENLSETQAINRVTEAGSLKSW
jgi:hypothetical protein